MEVIGKNMMLRRVPMPLPYCNVPGLTRTVGPDELRPMFRFRQNLDAPNGVYDMFIVFGPGQRSFPLALHSKYGFWTSLTSTGPNRVCTNDKSWVTSIFRYDCNGTIHVTAEGRSMDLMGVTVGLSAGDPNNWEGLKPTLVSRKESLILARGNVTFRRPGGWQRHEQRTDVEGYFVVWLSHWKMHFRYYRLLTRQESFM